ncbi:MAG: exopolysaccharide biosynthesis protein exod [Chthoniobacteraceae bacterium]|nr:exopolysaccharide biosynthesis protein exod [Chthoniobacteraceae bacterium]
MTESPPTDPVAPLRLQPSRRLSMEIDGLLARLGDQPVTLREMIAVIKERAYTLLLILLSLPFCLPVPLPGLSMVLGLIIALIGVRLSLRLEPWLPMRLLGAQIAPRHIARILTASKRIARTLEILLKPRWSLLIDCLLLHHLYGAMICISGLLLLLPLPIPLSNLLPALTIIFLASALLERDGYFVVAGLAMFVITLVFFAGLFLSGFVVLSWIEDWFGNVIGAQEPRAINPFRPAREPI